MSDVFDADDPWKSHRTIALWMAVMYHGATSQSPHAKPARVDTVIATAEEFIEYLDRQEDIADQNGRKPHDHTQRTAASATPRTWKPSIP